MSVRHLAALCAAGSLAAAALTLATPASAAMQDLPPIPPAPVAVAAPTGWYGGAQLDPRARDAWLMECRHRTAYYYSGGEHHRRGRHHHGDEAGHGPRYDYCEAYLDDYYRYYSQGGMAYGYGIPHTMQPMMVPSQVQREVPTEEVVTEEYVPIRSRAIPRRATPHRSHDKRIRIN